MSQNYLARAGGVVDRVTIFSIIGYRCSLITLQNLVTVSDILYTNVSPMALWTPSRLGRGVSDT